MSSKFGFEWKMVANGWQLFSALCDSQMCTEKKVSQKMHGNGNGMVWHGMACMISCLHCHSQGSTKSQAIIFLAILQGSLQLFGKITATSDNLDIDIVWVFTEEISADGKFRRICSLSMKQIAILCVNVKVTCNVGTVAPSCSTPTPQTTVMSETTTPETSDSTTATTVEEFTTEETDSTTTGSSTSPGTTTSVEEDTMVAGKHRKMAVFLQNISNVQGWLKVCTIRKRDHITTETVRVLCRQKKYYRLI